MNNPINDFTIKIVFYKYDAEEGKTYSLLQTITDYKEGASNVFSSYDEKLDLSENSQSSFTFKVIYKNKEKINPFISLLTIGREIQLHYENKYYYFVITKRTPKYLTDNIEFSFSCQDSFSYFLTKNSISTKFKDEEDSLDLKFTGKTIKELANEIIQRSNVSNKWKLSPELGSKKKMIASFPNIIYGDIYSTVETTATLDLGSSNTYNALIELANIFNGLLTVEYNEEPMGPHVITYKNKNFPINKYHKLTPSVNLNSFNLNESGNELCTILYVMGGKNKKDEVVTLLPAIPENVLKVYGYCAQSDNNGKPYVFSDNLNEELDYYNSRHEKPIYWTSDDSNFLSIIRNKIKTASSMLYNFDYFRKTGQMDESEYQVIDKILTRDFRNENLKAMLSSQTFYILNRDYNRAVDKEEELITRLAGDFASQLEAYMSNTINNLVTIKVDENGNWLTKLDESSIPDNSNTIATSQAAMIQTYINNTMTNIFNLWSDNYIRPRCLMGYELDQKIIDEMKITGVDSLQFYDKIIKKQEYLLNAACQEYSECYEKAKAILKIDPPLPILSGKFLIIQDDYGFVSQNAVEKLKDENIVTYTEYCNVKEKLHKLSLKISKKYSYNDEIFEFPGFHDCYITCMNLLKKICENTSTLNITQTEKIYSDYLEYNVESHDYLNVYNQAVEAREKIWTKLLQEHGHFIIEGEFLDEQQTDSNGLYSKAVAQFNQYSSPVLDYSAEMIDWELLLPDNVEPVELGDLLTIDTRGFNLSHRAETDQYSGIVVRFEVNRESKLITKINGVPIKFLQNNGNKKGTIFKKIEFIRNFNSSNKYYIELKFLLNDNSVSHPDFDFIRFLDDLRVLSYDVVKDDESTLLMVTGLSKNLRSNVTKIKISNETAMSSVVQKLLLRAR